MLHVAQYFDFNCLAAKEIKNGHKKIKSHAQTIISDDVSINLKSDHSLKRLPFMFIF